MNAPHIRPFPNVRTIAAAAVFIFLDCTARADATAGVSLLFRGQSSGDIADFTPILNGQTGTFRFSDTLPPDSYVFQSILSAGAFLPIGVEGTAGTRRSISLALTISSSDLSLNLASSFRQVYARADASADRSVEGFQINETTDSFSQVIPAYTHSERATAFGYSSVASTFTINSNTFSAIADGAVIAQAGNQGVASASASPHDFHFTLDQQATFTLDVTVTATSQGSWQLPFIPVSRDGITWRFFEAPSAAWFDPPAAEGFLYEMEGSSLFTRILDFPIGFSEPFSVIVNDMTLGTFSSGESVDFVALVGTGVSSFVISGIRPLVNPLNPVAFPIQLEFDTPTANFTMTPIVVPEPNSLWFLASAAFLLSSRRNRPTKPRL